MKRISLSLSNLLMVMAAIGNRDFLTMEGIVSPVRKAISDAPGNITLNTVFEISISMATLSMVYVVLADMPENQYAKVNADLAETLAGMANHDPEILAWLMPMVGQRDAAIKRMQGYGAKFFSLPDAINALIQ